MKCRIIVLRSCLLRDSKRYFEYSLYAVADTHATMHKDLSVRCRRFVMNKLYRSQKRDCKWNHGLLVRSVLLLFLLLAMVPAHAVLPAVVDGHKLPTLADVVEQIEHGVVNVTRQRSGQYFQSDEDWDEFENLFRFFSLPEPRSRPPRSAPQGRALGSGVIIDANQGYIITNAHVVIDENIVVTLSDGRAVRPDVLGVDADMDLALLQIEADGLTAIPIGDSDDLRVGDFVLALGSPFGLRATVTSGIVSALGRHGLGMDKYENFIQTDAAINPGNSGGPLVNLRGEVIGINSAIFAPTGGNIGIGFAIPINAAYSVISQIAEHGKVRRGLLGIRFQELTPSLAESLGVELGIGVVVSSVIDQSAAQEAGLQDGDLLTHINGIEVSDGAHLRSMIALIRAGDIAKVRYLREGVAYRGEGTILPRGFNNISGAEVNRRFAGAEFKNHQGNDVVGVRVDLLEEFSPAWNLGLREQDVIIEVNRQEVENVSDLESSLHRNSRRLFLTIVRNGNVMFLTSAR